MCGYYKHSEGKNKIISLTENDIKEMVTHCISLIHEGSVFIPKGNGTINYTVNHSSIDADNAGFDTRIFVNNFVSPEQNTFYQIRRHMENTPFVCCSKQWMCHIVRFAITF